LISGSIMIRLPLETKSDFAIAKWLGAAWPCPCAPCCAPCCANESFIACCIMFPVIIVLARLDIGLFHVVPFELFHI